MTGSLPTRSAPLYVLSLRQTPHRYYVTRSEWLRWGGDVVAMNERRISPHFGSRERTKEFCREYTAEHSGCASADEARARIEEVASF